MNNLCLAALSGVLLAGPAARAPFEGVLVMKMTSFGSSGTMTTWISKTGSRSEIALRPTDPQKAAAGATMKMVTIEKKADPGRVVFLNEVAKTYAVADTKHLAPAAGTNPAAPAYNIKKLGKGTVAGFPCDRALVTGKTGNNLELCICREITGNSPLLGSLRGREEGGSLVQALKDAGLEGFPIRAAMTTAKSQENQNRGMLVELTSATRQAVPASTFEIPVGYKKVEAGPPGAPTAAGKGATAPR